MPNWPDSITVSRNLRQNSSLSGSHCGLSMYVNLRTIHRSESDISLILTSYNITGTIKFLAFSTLSILARSIS